MKKILYILLSMLLCGVASHAQTTDIIISDTTNTLKLQRLLDVREQLFYQYSYQIQTKTGIFGNQTVKDLKAANEILLEVVGADNKIITQLDAVIKEQRYIDRTEENTKIEADQRLIEYGKLTDKLKAQTDAVQAKADEEVAMQARWTYFSLAVALVFCILWVAAILSRRRQ